MGRRLAIITLGEIHEDPELPSWLQRQIAADMGLDVFAGPRIGLHDDWLDSRSGNYDSNRIIDALVDALAPDAGDSGLPDFDWTLALTDVDLCAPGRPFVFGEATLGGPCAVVSLARLRSSDPEVLRQRTLKEAVHEIGHLAGMEHCRDPRCVMFPSDEIHDTDVKGHRFCDACRDRPETPLPP